MPKMNLTHYITKNYDNNSRLPTPEKQTQTNPTCSELVEPILSASGGKLAGKELEFFDAEGVPQFLQGNQLELPDPFLGQAQVLADLLQGLFLFSYQ